MNINRFINIPEDLFIKKINNDTSNHIEIQKEKDFFILFHNQIPVYFSKLHKLNLDTFKKDIKNIEQYDLYSSVDFLYENENKELIKEYKEDRDFEIFEEDGFKIEDIKKWKRIEDFKNNASKEILNDLFSFLYSKKTDQILDYQNNNNLRKNEIEKIFSIHVFIDPKFDEDDFYIHSYKEYVANNKELNPEELFEKYGMYILTNVYELNGEDLTLLNDNNEKNINNVPYLHFFNMVEDEVQDGFNIAKTKMSFSEIKKMMPKTKTIEYIKAEHKTSNEHIKNELKESVKSLRYFNEKTNADWFSNKYNKSVCFYKEEDSCFRILQEKKKNSNSFLNAFISFDYALIENFDKIKELAVIEQFLENEILNNNLNDKYTKIIKESFRSHLEMKNNLTSIKTMNLDIDFRKINNQDDIKDLFKYSIEKYSEFNVEIDSLNFVKEISTLREYFYKARFFDKKFENFYTEINPFYYDHYHLSENRYLSLNEILKLFFSYTKENNKNVNPNVNVENQSLETMIYNLFYSDNEKIMSWLEDIKEYKLILSSLENNDADFITDLPYEHIDMIKKEISETQLLINKERDKVDFINRKKNIYDFVKYCHQDEQVTSKEKNDSFKEVDVIDEYFNILNPKLSNEEGKKTYISQNFRFLIIDLKSNELNDENKKELEISLKRQKRRLKNDFPHYEFENNKDHFIKRYYELLKTLND